MNRRSRLLLACVLFVLLAGLVLGGPAIAAAGPKKGTGGWYWPVGTENFHGWDGYWKHRPAQHSWHMAQDMPVPQGSPVYAIADGVIAESNANAGYGGVLVLWHYTGAGQKFLAVYGHIIRGKGMNKGVKVKAGQVIGHVNSFNHCHFGIHPGNAYPPDGNPYRGHTYIESETYGWVDPVKFLKNNPAYLPYTAPPLPLVTTIATTSTPSVLGVADGLSRQAKHQRVRSLRPAAGTRCGVLDDKAGVDEAACCEWCAHERVREAVLGRDGNAREFP